MIKAIGLVKYANGVTVTKTLREVTGRSLGDCKDVCDILRGAGKGTWVEIVPDQMGYHHAVDLLIKAGVTLLVDDIAMPPVPEIDLFRQEMRTQVERMAAMLDGVVTWVKP